MPIETQERPVHSQCCDIDGFAAIAKDKKLAYLQKTAT